MALDDASPRSLLFAAPLAPLDAFLRAPLPGAPLLWDSSCWGEPAVAARGFAARWERSGAESPSALAQRASSLLTRVEARGGPETPPRCYGGVSFADAPQQGPWRPFGSGVFALPRLSYEVEGRSAWLRLNLLEGEQQGPFLGLIEEARRALLSGGDDHAPASSARVREPHDLEYRRVVAEALSAIERGELEKIVVARAIELATDGRPPWDALARLTGPHLVRFGFSGGDSFFFGATPERLLSFDGASVRTEALAGSTPAGEGAGERLLSSDKDLREHRVVVDAIAQALAPFGRVEAAPSPGLRELRHLVHLCTPIETRVERPAHALELLEVLHPTPAVCGLPREAAAAWLSEREGLARGWYAGPVGWFDGQGRGTFAVALRSALLREDRALVFVGAGVVRGSTPEGELSETLLKARAMLDALGVLA